MSRYHSGPRGPFHAAVEAWRAILALSFFALYCLVRSFWIGPKG